MSPDGIDGMLSEEIEEEIRHTPKGVRSSVVLIAHTKALLADEMPDDWRLLFLEKLDKMADGPFPIAKEVISKIRPACPTAQRMVYEARNAGENWSSSLDVIADGDVYREFVRLNPSLIEAVRLHHPRVS